MAEAFDDALEALGVYGQIGAANFHGTADAEFAAHGGDGDAGFVQQRAEVRQLGGIAEGERVAFAALHGNA